MFPSRVFTDCRWRKTAKPRRRSSSPSQLVSPMTPPSSFNNPALRSRIPCSLLILALAVAVAPPATLAAAAAAEAAAVKILTRAPGAYQIRFEDLTSSVPTPGPWPSSGLGLSNRGSAVPLWIDDGGDGQFGPGDAFEFVAEILPGTHGVYHEYASSNVYVLSLNAGEPARMVAATGARSSAPSDRARQDYADTLHLEVDTLLMRFGCRRESEHELWYWQKLASVDEAAFSHAFEIQGLDGRRGRVQLEVDLHGWSTLQARPDPAVRDHSLQIFLNDALVHEAAFDGKAEERITLPDLESGLLRDGLNTISLRVPARRDHEDRLIPDAVVLNWVKIRYPRTARIAPDRQAGYSPRDGVLDGPAALEAAGALRIYAADGTRIDVSAAGKAGTDAWVEVPARKAFLVAPAGTLLRPHQVLPFNGRRLAAQSPQADYIAIVHPDLLEAIEPLMRYRRAQGLSVLVVAVDEVYDAFNDGIPHPAALRSFLKQAYETGPRPAPRFVLLVGDASWDSKHEDLKLEHYAFKTEPLQNTGVGRAEGTPYAGLTANNRGLIPTWNYLSHLGHAASDNGFVSFDGDSIPEIAIGRFPAVDAQEVGAMVRKTIAHENTPDDAWRKNTLWITNEQPGFQDFSDRLASTFVEQGYVTHKVYPVSGEAGSTQRIIDAFDGGLSLVYFYGHGGRFIWRTSPQDLRDNQDLFSLADLDRLGPTAKTPVVMSFTCYSAPFDHPSEDSIGEKLVRIDGRGAVAVIAASWRIAPSLTMQAYYLAALRETETVGEALVEAKRRVRTPELTETINLLGDPALRLKVGAPAGDRAAIIPP